MSDGTAVDRRVRRALLDFWWLYWPVRLERWIEPGWVWAVTVRLPFRLSLYFGRDDR